LPSNAGSLGIAAKLGTRVDAARSTAEANIYVVESMSSIARLRPSVATKSKGAIGAL